MSDGNLSKPIVKIYLSTTAKSTTLLTAHLAKHIDALNNLLMIQFIYITEKNAEAIQKRGIRRTPTLIHSDRKFEGLEKIIQVLTPPKQGRETYGYGMTSPDEMLHQWQSEAMSRANDEDDDESNADVVENKMRARMAVFQKKRARMEGTSKEHTVPGGRKVKAKNNQKTYDGDSDFIKDAGVDQDRTDNTPTERFVEDADGELLLEDYYLNEAMAAGKTTKPRRRGMH